MIMEAVWEGLLAGYGIAIPVGAIAVLIVDASLRRGFSIGLMAGAGAATADLLYATLAALAGNVLAPAMAPHETLLRVASALVLVGIGGHGLWRSAGRGALPAARRSPEDGKGHAGTFFKFLSLTLMNPLTVAYFAALILGSENLSILAAPQRLSFVVAAGLASLSWQSLLAGIGALARKHLTPRFQQGTSIAGNVVVLGLGLRIIFQLLA
jgi:threonine/homoserine/homoserine lactone efflux protein